MGELHKSDGKASQGKQEKDKVARRDGLLGCIKQGLASGSAEMPGEAESSDMERVWEAMVANPVAIESSLGVSVIACMECAVAELVHAPKRAVAAIWSAGTPRGRRGAAKVLALVAAAAATLPVDVSEVYHAIRGQEFLKLYVAQQGLEAGDRLVGWLAADCAGGALSRAIEKSGFSFWLAVGMSAFASWLHALVLLSRAVAMDALLSQPVKQVWAICVPSVAAEVRAHAFKRVDPGKAAVVAGQDVLERVHVLCCLAFVMSQRDLLPPPLSIAAVLASTYLADTVKHAAAGRLNCLHPHSFYQLGRRVLASSPGPASARMLSFAAAPPAALLLRASHLLSRPTAVPLALVGAKVLLACSLFSLRARWPSPS